LLVSNGERFCFLRAVAKLGGHRNAAQAILCGVMLSEIIDRTNLSEEFCATLVGASKDHFREWLSGQRPVPRYLVPEVISVFGGTKEQLRSKLSLPNTGNAGIWFKLRRDNKCNTSDLEMIGIVRKLCFRVGQFFALRGQPSDEYVPAFERARSASTSGSTPEQQGRIAAQIIRREFGWDNGKEGIGEILRSNLRLKGLVVVESAFNEALVEGCSFLTDGPVSQMACLFVNVYKITWFRRNAVLLHELCHSIFDLGVESVSVDYKAEGNDAAAELRAEAFARECLVPLTVLVHFQNQIGFHWKSLTPRILAQLIAVCHAPQQMILKVALESELIGSIDFVRYSQFECNSLLIEFTTHGMTTEEYEATLSEEDKKKIHVNRTIRFGKRKLLLPVNYLASVIEALNDESITLAKAAELTLMDQYDFRSRFSVFLKNVD